MTAITRQIPPCQSETDLMARLVAAQNRPGNITRDVVTFAGFCDDRAELERHVITCEEAANSYDAVRTIYSRSAV
jgi:hypothetical protein